MTEFTIDELKKIDQMLENTPLAGTMKNLPQALRELVILREKIHQMIKEKAQDGELRKTDAES